jgi:hypothetical protein
MAIGWVLLPSRAGYSPSALILPTFGLRKKPNSLIAWRRQRPPVAPRLHRVVGENAVGDLQRGAEQTRNSARKLAVAENIPF